VSVYGFVSRLGSGLLMAPRNRPLPELKGEQALATDPNAHAALSASAGTGKTQVLTARVYRLLLQGAPPESILCLTFTKAGAAEMANRIGTRLAAWVRMPEKLLRKELFALGEGDDPNSLARARQLFAKVLDAPGGLRIQTIHGFAQSLLAAFPAEAGITPGFQALEGRAAEELAHRTLADLLADAEATGNEQLIRDVQCLSLRLGEGPAVDYLRQSARGYEQLLRLGDPAGLETKLRALMDLPEGSEEDHIAALCGDDGFDCELLRAVAEANRKWGAATGLGHAGVIDTWLALTPLERAAALPQLQKVVLTEKGTLRISPGQTKAEPSYELHAGRLAVLIGELLRIQNGCRLARDMAAGLRAGRAFGEAFARAKRAAGVADFDDLIAWARSLLERPGMGDWVRYKLDRRIDHILVDEAQDTNADQWAIILSLTDDFFSGASEAEGRWRTLLLVGDFKQAIYAFQGTDPREFERVRRSLHDRAKALIRAEDESDDTVRLAREFRDLSIGESFRSAQPVLDVVDKAIDIVGWENMGLPEPPRPHRACAANARLAGLVELWIPFALDGPDERSDEDEEGWLDLHERRYAERLAAQVKSWIDAGSLLASTGRPLGPGDILILVRSRGELASLIVARLFSAGVPVAGIDRLHLQEPLAVQDLLSAMTFAVQPLDDLNLASLLVSPLIGWSQEQLFDLTWGRTTSLWRALRDRAATDRNAAEARDALSAPLAMADFTTPARFLETILSGPLQGRRKLTRRLTLAARDPIDELMSSALEFERNEIASLERFLAWFRRGDVEITRDPSAPADEVRVMTVHGAKGLEAPIVILADAHADPRKLGRQNPPLAIELEGAKVSVVRPRKAELMPPFDRIVADEQSLALAEHWRLLYVGLTRAIERLVVAGLRPKRGELPDQCWHRMIAEALERLPVEQREDPLWGMVTAYRGNVKAAPSRRTPAPPFKPVALVPEWARRPAPPEARPPRPLAPSAVAIDDEAAPPPGPAMRAAARRGTLIHQLLERLVTVDADARPAAAGKWLEISAGVDDQALRDDIVQQVCAILSDARFAPLFGEASLGEAPLAATLPDGRVIAGTVDRLLVERERVSVIDFKTGRVPQGASDIPNTHRAQMEAYAAALRVIFPGRTVCSALLYTAGPKLIELTP
jgi:ATP-dependent helicase/nuclease subunit A